MNVNDLLNKRHKIPRLNISKTDERGEYTIIRHTKNGEIIEIKPEILKIIKKRLSGGEGIKTRTY